MYSFSTQVTVYIYWTGSSCLNSDISLCFRKEALKIKSGSITLDFAIITETGTNSLFTPGRMEEGGKEKSALEPQYIS